MTVEGAARARHPLGVRLLVVALVAAGCGSPSAPPLAPAGSLADDGVGDLARLSAKLEYGGADSDRRELTALESGDSDPLAGFGGFGYAGFGYGGDRYGGLLDVLPGIGDGWTGPPSAAEPYEVEALGDPGAIEGRVTWTADGGVRWPRGCGQAAVARAGAPVVGAVVSLVGIETGRLEPLSASGAVTAGPCALTPSVQVVGPPPTTIAIDNRRTATIVMTIGDATYPMSAGGRLEVAADRTGPVRVGAHDLAHDLAPAWVIAAPHPYYAVTDDAGRFALDLVPPGRYLLAIWHPPLALGIDGESPRWSSPVTATREVTVGRLGLVKLALTLAP